MWPVELFDSPVVQIVPAFGGTEDDKARVISTIFFISGVVTLLQTVLGDRLPIIQVSSGTIYISTSPASRSPASLILLISHWVCLMHLSMRW